MPEVWMYEPIADIHKLWSQDVNLDVRVNAERVEWFVDSCLELPNNQYSLTCSNPHAYWHSERHLDLVMPGDALVRVAIPRVYADEWSRPMTPTDFIIEVSA
jgi:hypothetical protein